MFGFVQARMARAALQWSTRELADEAKIHRNTISRIESGKAERGTLLVLREVFEKRGFRFTDEGGVIPPVDL